MNKYIRNINKIKIDIKLTLKIWRKKKKIRKIKEVLFKLIRIMGNFMCGLTKMGVLLSIRYAIIVRKIGLGMWGVIRELVKLLFPFNFIGMWENCTKI